MWGEEDIIQILKDRKMRWLGHVWRSNDIIKDALNWKPKGKKPLGRSKKGGKSFCKKIIKLKLH